MLLRCKGRMLDLSRPQVMGVLNVTPDSFSDGGRYFGGVESAVAHAVQMVEEGATLIDIGGESTRPGADPVSAEEEMRRVLPVLEHVREETDVIISVDTSKPEVMRAATLAGARMINDVRALQAPGALEAAVSSECAVCLMHMKGDPRTMQKSPRYVDVVEEVGEFLRDRAGACLDAGIKRDSIVVDPGFGFGKTQGHNLQLLRHLREVVAEWPALVGLSRKAMIGELTGRPPEQRVHGSVALAVMAVVNGARIVRVHDVAATVDALKIVAAVQMS
jgi:dihydropteroate synthase